MTQFGFGSLFITLYVASPSTAHRLVGYIEEMAVEVPERRALQRNAQKLSLEGPASTISTALNEFMEDASRYLTS